MKKILLSFLLSLSVLGFATHNRAGEILYKRIQPFTQIVGGETVQVFNYLITVVKYTNDDGGNFVADRCVDTVYFGDGAVGIAPRINGGACPSGCPRCGEMISTDVGFKVKLSTYTITHTYAGAGSYTIRSLDPNRNAGVHNIRFSDQQPFYIESFLKIDNFTGANSSPEFKNRPTDRACIRRCFYHNPAAFDIDGDSLSFELTPSRTENGAVVPGYFYPETGLGGDFSINALTGLITWCTPQFVDEYNIAFIVKEWRKNTSGVYVMIGYVLRDMQIIVNNCPDNPFPPDLIVPPDTCVEVGTLIQKNIFVKDSTEINQTSTVILSASGGAFSSPAPNGTLSLPSSYIVPYSATFKWQTDCEHLRNQPYQTVFKVTDSSSDPLVKFATYSIKVVPPSIKNVTASPVGSSIKIEWSATSCNPSSNPLVSYLIYRKNECATYTINPCELGVDPASGFELIRTNGPNEVTYTDNNGGNGLIVGQNYSYLVVAVYKDGSTSYGSSSVCVKLKRDIPVLLNIDVLTTSASSGSVFVRWSKPLINTGNLDTLLLPGPYTFNLLGKQGNNSSFNTVYTTSSPYFLNLDTIYTQGSLNTLDSTLVYSVQFVAGTTTVGSSPLATSVFLKAIGNDREIELNWTSATPWNNYKYSIYRKDPSASTFSLLAITTQTAYIDSSGIVNRNSYCYKILAEGKYSDPGILKPLLNNSQELCATARDLLPPCTPSLSIDADCLSGFVKVTWNDIRQKACGDDVVKYVLFYKATVDADYSIVDTLDNNTLSYTFDGLELISGCYALQAVDSSGNASSRSPDFCLDNCPIFELPNIFTPNGDGANDFYKAVKVRQIKEINLNIYDRWGNLVYTTRDPYFKWDGTSLQSKVKVSDGTFFYFCEVFEPRLTGIKTRNLQGFVQVVK